MVLVGGGDLGCVRSFFLNAIFARTVIDSLVLAFLLLLEVSSELIWKSLNQGQLSIDSL